MLVRTDELLAKVKENRENHRKIFEEAVEGYMDRSIELLEEHLERIKSGKLEQVHVSLPYPSDHTQDYDRVIAMLEMTIEEEIEIDQSSFAMYVMDEWHWKGEFLRTNSAYSLTAANLM